MPVGAEQRAEFNIKEEIGLPPTLPERQTLFERSAQAEIPFAELVTRDDFVTRVVLNEQRENFDQDFVRELYSILTTIDGKINANGSLISSTEQKPDKGFRSLSRCYEQKDVIDHQRRYLDGLEETVNWLPKQIVTVIGLPMMGALSIRRQLEKRKLVSKLLFNLPIAGSSGTKSGESELTGVVPPELLDTDAIGIFGDDVLDTSVSLVRWALARQIDLVAKGGDVINETAFNNPDEFFKRVNKAKDGNLSLSDTDKLWKEVADLVWGVNIIVAPIYFKNTSLRDAIDHKVNEGLISGDRMKHQKARAQLNLLDHTKSIDKKYWIIGGVGEWEVPLLDMKILGEKLLKKFNKSPYKKQLEEWGLGKLDLRVFSGLNDLLAYNPDGLRGKEAVDKLYNFLAEFITDYAELRHHPDRVAAN